jgi:WD40 repeat protein
VVLDAVATPEARHLADALQRGEKCLPPLGIIARWVVSPDGKRLATVDMSGKTVQVWDTQTATQEWWGHPHSPGIAALRFSKDGKNVLVEGADRVGWSYETQSGKLIARFMVQSD